MDSSDIIISSNYRSNNENKDKASSFENDNDNDDVDNNSSDDGPPRYRDDDAYRSASAPVDASIVSPD